MKLTVPAVIFDFIMLHLIPSGRLKLNFIKLTA